MSTDANARHARLVVGAALATLAETGLPTPIEGTDCTLALHPVEPAPEALPMDSNRYQPSRHPLVGSGEAHPQGYWLREQRRGRNRRASETLVTARERKAAEKRARKAARRSTPTEHPNG